MEKESVTGYSVANVLGVCKMMIAENADIAKTKQNLEDKIDCVKNVCTGVAKWIPIEKETQRIIITVTITLDQQMDLFLAQYLQ